MEAALIKAVSDFQAEQRRVAAEDSAIAAILEGYGDEYAPNDANRGSRQQGVPTNGAAGKGHSANTRLSRIYAALYTSSENGDSGLS
jgi:hypothetical protein